MTDNDRLQARGRMAYLHDDIRSRSRERDTLLRALRERVYRALPSGVADSELANLFDCQAAHDELAAVTRAEATLADAVDEYNRLAAALALPGLKRRAY